MAKKKKSVQKRWVYVGVKKEEPKILEADKKKVETAFEKVIEKLKEEHVEKAPLKHDFNYLIDVKSKWYRHYFYLYSIYKGGTNCTVDSFESKFCRLEYVEKDKFNLAFMRHTEKWFEIGFGISLDDCVEQVLEGGLFVP